MTAESQGLLLLSRLHSALQMADPKTAPVLRFLFLQTLQPVVSALWQWLFSLIAQVRQVIIVDWPGGQAPLLTTMLLMKVAQDVKSESFASMLAHLVRWALTQWPIDVQANAPSLPPFLAPLQRQAGPTCRCEALGTFQFVVSKPCQFCCPQAPVCAVAECSLESTHDSWNRRGQQGAGRLDSIAYPLAFQTEVLRKV